MSLVHWSTVLLIYEELASVVTYVASAFVAAAERHGSRLHSR